MQIITISHATNLQHILPIESFLAVDIYTNLVILIND